MTRTLQIPKETVKLGMTYGKDETTIRVWAPDLPLVELGLYENANAVRRQKLAMKPIGGGVHEIRLKGDMEGRFYTFIAGDAEVTDPYSVASASNSRKSAIVDLRATDPPGFREAKFQAVPQSEAIVYELHVGDFTYDSTSGNFFRGKYLSLTQENTFYGDVRTGLGHLRELGITHVHLMPVFDFLSVDESPGRFGAPDNYNWGYDPELYNVPEGAYSIDPESPHSRISELKRMIRAIHDSGIGVVMDVVYNHTYQSEFSNFNTLVPDYYYRMSDGHFSNGSGCGNELATEREMVRRFIVDSLLYWQEEYQIDGFRFDLMALIDRETIETARKKLSAKNPNILLYGEPWTAQGSLLPSADQFRWRCQNDIPVALFNDGFRDAIRGDNDGFRRGFLQGNYSERQAVELGLCGWIDYDSWHRGDLVSPLGSINYFNAHDNLILEDKLRKSAGDDEDAIDGMTRLAFGILLTAQGIPFFHEGNEFRRSKQGDRNSYNAPYSINAVRWSSKAEHIRMHSYVRDLIRLRREREVFRLKTADEIRSRIRLLTTGEDCLIAVSYREKSGFLIVLHNASNEVKTLDWGIIQSVLTIQNARVRKLFDEHGFVGEEALPRNPVNLAASGRSTTIYELKTV